jgi:hypothetical protein
MPQLELLATIHCSGEMTYQGRVDLDARIYRPQIHFSKRSLPQGSYIEGIRDGRTGAVDDLLSSRGFQTFAIRDARGGKLDCRVGARYRLRKKITSAGGIIKFIASVSLFELWHSYLFSGVVIIEGVIVSTGRRFLTLSERQTHVFRSAFFQSPFIHISPKWIIPEIRVHMSF